MPPDAQGKTLFIDRSLGGKIVPRVLRENGHTVVVHDDVFAQDTPDTEWIRHVGENGWIFICGDTNVGRNGAEVLAIFEARVHGFALKFDGATGPQRAQAILLAMPQIYQVCQRHSPPTLHRIYRDGQVSGYVGYDEMARKILGQST